MYAISSGLKARIRLPRLGRVGRRAEDQDAQVFFDVVKAVLDPGRHEDQAAGLDRPVLAFDFYLASPADHVIDLVLSVGVLAIGLAFRPEGQADAHLVRGQEVDGAVAIVIASLGIKVGYVECFHCSKIPSPCYRATPSGLS